MRQERWSARAQESRADADRVRRRKSGSLFFFSNDMRFIVKTLPKREALLLREILPAYYQHVKQNPGTYLPRFYGLHRWKPEYGRNVR